MYGNGLSPGLGPSIPLREHDMPDTLVRHPYMSQVALTQCNAHALVGAMLAFELALAEVQEARGAMPEGASEAMRRVFKQYTFDTEALAQGVGSGGNKAIPFVKLGRAA